MKKTMFEVNYYQYKLSNWDKKKEELKSLIDKTKSHNNFLDKTQDQETSFFNNKLDVYDIIKNDLVLFCNEINYDVNFLNCWYQQYNKNQFHTFHNHPNSDFSGVIFVNFDSKIHKSTKFLNPLNPFFVNKTFYSPYVEEGDMIIFPSWLLHESPINTSKKLRTIVSFNLQILDQKKIGRAHV